MLRRPVAAARPPSRRPAARPRAAGLALALLAGAATAHTPHDVLGVVEPSPDHATDGTLLAAATLSEDLVWMRSEDDGLTWDQRAHPLLDGGVTAIRYSPDFAADRTVFVATRRRGVWVSTDGGETLVPAVTGLDTQRIYGLAISPDFPTDGTLVAATELGVRRSVDFGATWAPADTGLVETQLERVAFAGGGDGSPSVLFVAGHTLHRSTDGGDTWTPVLALADDCRAIAPSPDFDVDGLVSVGVESIEGVLTSVDGGLTFSPDVASLTELAVRDMVVLSDGSRVCITRSEGTWSSPGPGAPWTRNVAGLGPLSPLTTEHYADLSVVLDGADDVVFVSAYTGLYASTDGGTTWRQRDVYGQRIHRALVVSPAGDGTLFAANFGGGLQAGFPGLPPGAIPPDVGPPPTAGAGPGPGGLGTSGTAGGTLRGATLAAPSPTDGATPPFAWSFRAQSIADSVLFPYPLLASPDFADDDTLYYGHVGLWRSGDRGLSWEALPTASPTLVVRGLATSPDFATDGMMLHGTEGGFVYRSEDRGDSWTPWADGLGTGVSTRAIAISPDWPTDGTVFLATLGQGLWRRTAAGPGLWTLVDVGQALTAFRDVALSPDFAADRLVIAGSMDGGLLVSTDAGDTWATADFGPGAAGADVLGVAFSPDYLADRTAFAATTGAGIFRSDDGCATWTRVDVDLTPQYVRVIALSPDFATDRTLHVTSHDWIWRSTDAGVHWTRLPGAVRTPESHPQVFASGPWTSVPVAGAHGQGVATAELAGASAEFAFHGDSITWHAGRGPSGGIAEVHVDGVLEDVLDLYAPPGAGVTSAAVWSHRFDEAGAHEVRVVVTGTKNRASSGSIVANDGFSYTF